MKEGMTPMAVSQGFLDYVAEQLSSVAQITHRRMFGAVGLYADDVFFGIIDDDELYFKVDDATRPAFEERGMEPFRPYGDERSMNYYQLPADVLEDVDALALWMRDAVEVGRRAAKSPRRRRRRR